MLTLRTTARRQVAASGSSSASKTDLNLFGGLFGGRAGAGLGGYTNTPPGQVITAAFMDAFNQMVRSLRNYRAERAGARAWAAVAGLAWMAARRRARPHARERAQEHGAPRAHRTRCR